MSKNQASLSLYHLIVRFLSQKSVFTKPLRKAFNSVRESYALLALMLLRRDPCIFLMLILRKGAALVLVGGTLVLSFLVI